MTDKDILAAYYAAEQECGGPHCIKDAIWQVVVQNPPLTYEEVREIVINDQIKGM